MSLFDTQWVVWMSFSQGEFNASKREKKNVWERERKDTKCSSEKKLSASSELNRSVFYNSIKSWKAFARQWHSWEMREKKREKTTPRWGLLSIQVRERKDWSVSVSTSFNECWTMMTWNSELETLEQSQNEHKDEI